MLSKIYDSLLTLAYPQNCAICRNSVERSSDGVACESCWTRTKLFTGKETLCEKCGAFLIEKTSNSPTFCHRCDQHFYDRAVSAGLYEHGLSASILHLKIEPFVSRKLKNIFLARFNKANFSELDLIIPVPLSAKRRLERGFNQAEILSELLAKHTKIEVDKYSLARKTHTPMHRAGMDRKAREMTVKNAFKVERKRLIEYKNILLVDDVFTSGATASNCAKELKKNGAGLIFVYTVARVA